MPSFFEGLKRIVQGKPVFDESDSTDAPNVPTEGDKKEDAGHYDGVKQLPLVTIESYEYEEHGGNHINYDLTIHNHSNVTVELDKIDIFDTHHEINDHLGPGQAREFTVFYGDKFANSPSSHCELIYKTLQGDYFKTMHYIETEKHADGAYYVRRIKYMPPVRDF